MKKVTFLLMLFAFLAISVPVAACGNDDGQQIKEAKVENATFEGTLVCMGCDLKKSEGARSACKTTGCNHTIKTADGRYINLLENQYSAELIKGGDYHGKSIKIDGDYYAMANMLDVKSFTVDGKEKSWCGHCNQMDGCMVSRK